MSYSPFVSVSSCTVSMWTMAHHQVAAPWTQWPAQAQASSCRPILSTANGESHFSTAPTVTMTSRPSLCPETPPLPVTCKCIMSFDCTQTFLKCIPVFPVVLNVFISTFLSASLNLCHAWMCIRAGLKAPAPVGSVHDQQLIVWCHIYS